MVKNKKVLNESIHVFPLRGKRGWLRIVEAVFGILIMSGVLLAVYSGQNEPVVKNSDYIVGLERDALEKVADNDQLREEVLGGSYSNLNIVINASLPSNYNYTFLVCNITNMSCVTVLPEKEIYSEEVIIAASTTKYEPKIVRLFAWSNFESA